MRLFRHLAGGLTGLALLAVVATADTPRPAGRAPKAEPPSGSPLRLIPAEADLVLQVDSPRRAAEAVVNLDSLKQLQAFPAFKELLDNTQARRGQQLLAYFEKELGAKWPELLDRLAGGGIAVGSKFGGDPAPVLAVVQGKDEELLKKFVAAALLVAEGELARQEVKARPAKAAYRGIETVHIGKDFHLARAGTALLVSNNQTALKRGLDLHLGLEKNGLASAPSVAEAARLLPKAPLARLWINMKAAHDSPQGKALYKSPRDDFNLTILVGSVLDVLGRSPFVAAGVYAKEDGFLLTVRMPRGRDGMGNDRLLHLPPEGRPGTRPLLGPKDVLYSQSFYLDLANFWKERDKLFPKQVAEGLSKFDKTSGRFLAGAKLGKLLSQTAGYHRVVAVNQDQAKAGYARKPKQAIPAFAFIPELREPEKFARSMDTILRGAALLATTQVKLKLTEEKHKGVDIVGYRFDEKAPLKSDVNDIRFAFSPCFARVGNQFIFCSTIELCRELVELLQEEQKSPPKGHPATSRIRLYGAGAAQALKDAEDQLITQVILDQAVPPGEARAQVRAFIDFVRQQGTLRLEATYRDKDFRYELRTRVGK
jgi:hypothetical protein